MGIENFFSQVSFSGISKQARRGQNTLEDKFDSFLFGFSFGPNHGSPAQTMRKSIVGPTSPYFMDLV